MTALRTDRRGASAGAFHHPAAATADQRQPHLRNAAAHGLGGGHLRRRGLSRADHAHRHAHGLRPLAPGHGGDQGRQPVGR